MFIAILEPDLLKKGCGKWVIELQNDSVTWSWNVWNLQFFEDSLWHYQKFRTVYGGDLQKPQLSYSILADPVEGAAKM